MNRNLLINIKKGLQRELIATLQKQRRILIVTTKNNNSIVKPPKCCGNGCPIVVSNIAHFLKYRLSVTIPGCSCTINKFRTTICFITL